LQELSEPRPILVLVAVADAHTAGMAPQARGGEQKSQSCDGQCGVPPRSGFSILVTMQRLS